MEGLEQLVERALAEDLGDGDLTSKAVVDERSRGRARIIQKQPGVVFGLDAAAEAFRQAGAPGFDGLIVEGQWRDAVPAEVALASGPARALLAAERVALNLLCHLSGIATLTARFIDAIRDSEAAILDTRKTTPGLRALEKAAVAAGGGRNHRMGLYDAILIKENHIVLAGGIGAAIERARQAAAGREVEVECASEAEVEEALAGGADRLLLDNMDPASVEAIVARRDGAGTGRPLLEASGGVTLENVAAVAASGVDFISIGALTHSAPALDLSLLIEPA